MKEIFVLLFCFGLCSASISVSAHAEVATGFYVTKKTSFSFFLGSADKKTYELSVAVPEGFVIQESPQPSPPVIECYKGQEKGWVERIRIYSPEALAAILDNYKAESDPTGMKKAMLNKSFSCPSWTECGRVLAETKRLDPKMLYGFESPCYMKVWSGKYGLNAKALYLTYWSPERKRFEVSTSFCVSGNDGSCARIEYTIALPGIPESDRDAKSTEDAVRAAQKKAEKFMGPPHMSLAPCQP